MSSADTDRPVGTVGRIMLWVEDSVWPSAIATVLFLLFALSHTPATTAGAFAYWLLVVPLVATLIYFLTQEIPLITTFILVVVVATICFRPAHTTRTRRNVMTRAAWLREPVSRR